jgi:5'-nucleotidase
VANDLDAQVAGPSDWPVDVAHVAGGGVSLTPLQPELFWRGSEAALPALPQLPLGR